MLEEDPEKMNIDVVRNTPLFLYQGDEDARLPLANSIRSFEYLKNEIYTNRAEENYEFRTEQDLDHEIGEGMLDLARRWITARCEAIEIQAKFKEGRCQSYIKVKSKNRDHAKFSGIVKEAGNFCQIRSKDFAKTKDLA